MASYTRVFSPTDQKIGRKQIDAFLKKKNYGIKLRRGAAGLADDWDELTFVDKSGRKVASLVFEETEYSENLRADIQDYLKIVGLEKFMDSRVNELSGGMKQRVGIARALVTHPDIILMDEPFGALDAQTRNIMQVGLINILDKTDQTIIFVTHSVEEAVFLSDRIVVLTKRPATIKEIIEIPWPRPRDRTNEDFIALRKKILAELEKENVME